MHVVIIFIRGVLQARCYNIYPWCSISILFFTFIRGVLKANCNKSLPSTVSHYFSVVKLHQSAANCRAIALLVLQCCAYLLLLSLDYYIFISPYKMPPKSTCLLYQYETV